MRSLAVKQYFGKRFTFVGDDRNKLPLVRSHISSEKDSRRIVEALIGNIADGGCNEDNGPAWAEDFNQDGGRD
jgi:hypothetical protein